MTPDADTCYRALRSRDARFDGWFFAAVTSTGIYCRPSCPALTPKRANVCFHPTAAAAQRAGFRACKRCRPDAAPGSPEWDVRGDVAARAMRLIADGVVDRDGVPGLAARLGYSARQVERLLAAEVGAGPLALARAQRAQTARVLAETTAMDMAQVAFAAGFASLRQFNDTIRSVFDATPSQLRDRARTRPGALRDRAAPPNGAGADHGQTIAVRLPFRAPLCPDNLFGHLAATAVPGVEEVRDGSYRRTLHLPHGSAIVALRPATAHVAATLRLEDVRDLPTAIARCRRLLDLDADPVAVDEQLAEDPALGPVVRARPGRRVPRTVDPGELALRAVLGQQVSTAAARTHAGRLAAVCGRPVRDPAGTLNRTFPEPSAVAQVLAEGGHALAGPRGRHGALRALAEALADARVDLGPGADWARAREQLGGIPGVGPWTVEIIGMRGLGDPDAFPVTDLGVRRAAARAGLPATPAALARRAGRWRPWRAYAVQYLWSTLDHPVNELPFPGQPHREGEVA